MTEPLRLGVIGANPEAGWASRAHLPAAQALAEIDLVAVATTRTESAEAAREAYGARNAYADASRLLADPDVEAVTIAVRVPGHGALVEQALLAGKHVYCEWPLTTDTSSASALHRLAADRGLETMIGLHGARALPIRWVAETIARGELGELLSVSVHAVHALGGRTLPQSKTYQADAASGANVLTITTGHALDTVCAVAGEIAELSATVETRLPRITVVETGESIRATSPDEVSITGTLDNGAVLTARVQRGLGYEEMGLTLDIRGELGAIHVTARPGIHSGNVEIVHVDGTGESRVMSPPEPSPALAGVPSGPPAFVASMYLDFVRAIRTGERAGPDFAHAVRRHRLLDSIVAAAAEGVRQSARTGEALVPTSVSKPSREGASL
ncbi:Gfo/Idh/MocA family protein [Actinomadura welshii]|uniref:Gfo/Idh/MocA family protein n=1 Tax=Actinomadura welshii TaxID=3103817 RepID=UPI0003AD25C6|nr:Gfo/Idh/MocA family oxidoreductase [Actinomadura madurae]